MTHGPAEHRVADGDTGQRLDRYLRKLLPSAPLSALHRALRKREITLDGARAEPATRLERGAVLEFRGRAATLLDEIRAAPAPGSAWHGPTIEILYRDEDILAVAKPAGVAVQPGPVPCLVDWLAARADLRPAVEVRTFRVAPAHRLDRGTSGVVLVGLSPAGLRGLTEAFREHRIAKTYLALVCGVPARRCGTITAPLRVRDRAPADGPKTVVDPDGLAATTHYAVVARRGRDAVVRVEIETGRTHQIRAHLAHLGHPLRGDARYGGGRGALMLHAWRVELEHPVTGAMLRIEAAPPLELRPEE